MLAVYAVYNRQSLENLSDWIARARKRAEVMVKVIVLGNKCNVLVGKTADASGPQLKVVRKEGIS
jgi:predicted nucleic acid-binding protein